jgi:hypothetical protein
MERVRNSSFEEFVRWYLARERRKHNQDDDLSGRSWDSLLAEMRSAHPGKLRPWFERGRWSIMSLCVFGEATSLVCVDAQETRRDRLIVGSAPNNRLAGTLVAAAHATGYFYNCDVRRTNAVQNRYLQRNWPQLREGDRLTLCSLSANEKRQNPGGSYYLHDGFGRLLPWLYVILYEGEEYSPIEAFLAEEN